MHQEIYLGDTSVRVIGLLKAKGGPDSVDEKIIVPMTLAMQRIIGQDHLDAINITVRSHDMVQEAEAALIHALREFRGLTPGEEDNFRFFSQTEVLEEINRSIGMFKALLGGVAAVSLLVGGIGIMNIMLVTVTERTREIGIRKALGARRRDIMTQFLIESVVVACIGGALGIALGWGIAAVFDKFVEQFETLVTPASVILAVSCSTAIGLIFGIYPARRASKLDPIEALRYE
jgi:putative ABC transport system permease protein